MNIFFYTTRGSDVAKCYLEQLRGLPDLKEMMIFPAGTLFLSSLSLKLRSGDLLILFVANTEELDELLALRTEFNEFRIILILADSRILRKAHSLYPSFIAFPDEKMMEIEAVIQKITEPDMLFHDDNNSSFTPLSMEDNA